ncbi:MAG: ribonuclease III domain-containing protein [Mariprofundales bacterium]|nr:ribonuclease III domain-containing protein [Mariprofundales bacterium]
MNRIPRDLSVSGSGRKVGGSSLLVRIGHQFTDMALLDLALTHCSLGGVHYERLEFLGDAVLELIISDELYRSFPDWPEGRLSRMRSALVDRDALLITAQSWELASELKVGRGERTPDGVVRSPSIVVNAVEAVLGAIYLDAGIVAATKVVLAAWDTRLQTVGDDEVVDAKSRLQEWTQARGWGTPGYVCSD